MVTLIETLKTFLNITTDKYDFIFIIFSCLFILFVFDYILGLIAYLFKFIGGIR